MIRIPEAIIFIPVQDEDRIERQFTKACYPNIGDNTSTLNFANTVILTICNTQADHLNDIATDLFCPDKDVPVYVATGSVSCDDDGEASCVTNQRDLKNFVSPDFPPYELRLKPGLPIMCIRNIDVINNL
ncbi:hypothetical protein BGW38_005014 [Lunasporangiospora selenospora]|uniref:DNA helicase Pif1-like 2B domain-containing protein n=1 Tax=Lunasporangiospora selenospora TaxID=979761 RepID=A0A9P6FPQ5_9FUNG|nr:hypothetical protein BGW38_005014 [Lunasporangiospora selenospora]